MKLLSKFFKRWAVLWRVSGEAGAKGRLTQLYEMIWMAGTREFSPGEYWVYGFHMRNKSKDAIRCYLPSKIYFSEVLPRLNNHKSNALLENKWLFFLHYREAHISTPHCFGVFHPASGFSLGGNDLKTPKHLVELVSHEGLTRFIAKPVGGTSGIDIFKIEVEKIDGDEFHFKVKDKIHNAKSLVDFLSSKLSQSKNAGFLLQECIEQHSDLNKLSPSACMNIRIVTLLKPNGMACITRASTRIGRVGAVVSNAGSGGILASVDTGTGRIVKCRSSYYIDAVEVTRHPDTGVDISNFEIPYWDEAVELCLKAANKLPGISSVGWDVLIDANGATLLEGNHDWDVISEQLFGAGYLSEENRLLLKEQGISFSYDETPKFRFGKVLQFVN